MTCSFQVDKLGELNALVQLVPGTSNRVKGNVTFIQKSADNHLQIKGNQRMF